MSVSILSNVAALNARRHLEENSEAVSKAAERISSGRRINRPADDAAGLAISNAVEADIRSIGQARRNTLEALSLVQVSEGGMNEVGNILIRLRELAIQSASDTVGDRERELLELEAGQLKQELSRIAESTRYFGTQLLNGKGKDFVFQVGIDNDENSRITYASSQTDLRPSTLGVDGIDLRDKDSALDSLEMVDKGLGRLAIPISHLGGMQTRLNSINNQLMTYEENMTAARSKNCRRRSRDRNDGPHSKQK